MSCDDCDDVDGCDDAEDDGCGNDHDDHIPPHLITGVFTCLSSAWAIADDDELDYGDDDGGDDGDDDELDYSDGGGDDDDDDISPHWSHLSLSSLSPFKQLSSCLAASSASSRFLFSVNAIT